MTRNLKLRIVQDEHPESPREWDTLGIMVCFHKRYNLGDKHDLRSEGFDGWDALQQYLVDEEEATHVLPIYLYDHSGLTMNTGGFSCPWDSGQVGFIYTTAKRIAQCYGETVPASETIENALRAEVQTYDQYLRGDVWGYCVIEVETCDKGHEHEETIDSCWGFFGEESAREEGQRSLEACLAS